MSGAPIVYGEVTVEGVERIAPAVRRVVLTGPVLADYVPGRPAEAFRLMLPPRGADRVDFPHTGPDGLPAWRDDQARPSLRAQTVRRAEPGRVVFDVMERADTAWPARVAPGDLLGVAGMRFGYAGSGSRVVLVGDRSALPALGAIIESGAVERADVVLVGPVADEEIALLPAGQALQRAQTLDAVAGCLGSLRGTGVAHLYAAGEVRVVAAAYRAGREVLGLPADALQPVVYWERGLSADERDPAVYLRYQQAAQAGRDVADPQLVADLELTPVRI